MKHALADSNTSTNTIRLPFAAGLSHLVFWQRKGFVTMAKSIALTATLALVISGTAVLAPSAPASAAPSVGGITNYYGNNNCLDAKDDSHSNPYQNGDPVQMWACTAGTNQQWRWEVAFTVNYATYYKIRNQVSGKCLDAENDSRDNPDNNGDKVQLWTCNGGSNQLWIIGSDGPSPYLPLENVYALEHGHLNVLDARNAGGWNPNINGDPVQIYSDQTTPNQWWYP
jgi:hypothetical protein